MDRGKFYKIALPLLPGIIIIVALFVNAMAASSSQPRITGGLLDLSQWPLESRSAFNLSGQWEFYWDRLLDHESLTSSGESFVIVEAPDVWNEIDVEGYELPGFGKATYRAHVTGVIPGQHLAVRIQSQASTYRLYIDDRLVAANGQFGDQADAPASQYRPQMAEFAAPGDHFDIIMQVSNQAYAVGGMWDPVMFGSYDAVNRVNNAVKFVDYFSMGGLMVMCLFFAILFALVRREKGAMVLCAIGVLVIIRLLEYGEALIIYLIPAMPIAGFGWIDYLTQIWIQFFLLYFIYLTFTSLVQKWHVRSLFIYSLAVSFFVLAFPFEIVVSTYQLMSLVLLLVIIAIVYFTGRAVLEGRTGARSLLAAMAFILFSMLYEFTVDDLSILYFLINGWALDFMVLFAVQCVIVARRYSESQRLELGLLRSQIRPHFVHNALATIISISRKEPERSRELLIDFSSYLRGCYDYEGDDLIPLADELEFVQAYVALEQARFGDRYKVDYQLDVMNIMLPPLVLQPLVENAFIHGLREKEEGGTVVVYSQVLKNNMVRIGVKDDGVGMKSQAQRGGERSGIGLANINRRLARLFNTQLKFTEPAAGGCEVFMEIAVREVDSSASYNY